MTKAEIKQRAKNYHDHATKILYFWNGCLIYDFVYKLEINKIAKEEIDSFENLVCEYFATYYSDFKYNCFTKSKFERAKISNVVVNYCVYVKSSRWKELESYIINDNVFVIDYIKNVIKNRLVEYEEILRKKNSPKKLYEYAKAIKQKLPEEFHNVMIAYSTAGNKHALNYLRNIT